jgi:light-regulated signal transduction histidine kinase (bacteriophytochrome)
MLEVVPELRNLSMINDFKTVVEEDVTLYREQHYQRDDMDGWFASTMVKLNDGLVVIFRDITKRKAAEQQMERINAMLEQRNRELQDFAYVASHDLQEPLRKIRAFADLLEEEYADRVDKEGQYYLTRMRDAATRMSRLITDLLAYSRVTTKAHPFHKVDLNEVAREVLSDLELQISEIEGSIELAPLPTIEADPTQMRQLLQNLIGNALKFTKTGVRPVVTIKATLENEGDPEEALCFLEVSDNGIGFNERYLDRIFTPFQRLHGRGTYAGTGMGLAICRRIAERHQGTLTAQSTPGEGATFITILPVHQPTSQPEQNLI